MSDVRISQHAIERYIERWDPSMPFEQASRVLEHIVARSSRLREKTRAGHEVWGSDGVRFVVKYDARGTTIATVLPRAEERFCDLPVEDMRTRWEAQRAYLSAEGYAAPDLETVDTAKAAFATAAAKRELGLALRQEGEALLREGKRELHEANVALEKLNRSRRLGEDRVKPGVKNSAKDSAR